VERDPVGLAPRGAAVGGVVGDPHQRAAVPADGPQTVQLTASRAALLLAEHEPGVVGRPRRLRLVGNGRGDRLSPGAIGTTGQPTQASPVGPRDRETGASSAPGAPGAVVSPASQAARVMLAAIARRGSQAVSDRGRRNGARYIGSPRDVRSRSKLSYVPALWPEERAQYTGRSHPAITPQSPNPRRVGSTRYRAAPTASSASTHCLTLRGEDASAIRKQERSDARRGLGTAVSAVGGYLAPAISSWLRGVWLGGLTVWRNG
jgi:hypothetical protein